ncbi:MAG: GNAT family N-acetyltransferase [Vicinamibacterales bacterium]|nr:GNAT family N-acetyltransferase [Vicinamibacterales bacterium]
MSRVETRGWTAGDEPEVERFVAGHPEGLVYYLPAFRRYLLAVAGGECRSRLAFEDGRLTGVLPVLVLKGAHGDILNSQPFFGSNGGVLATTAAAETALRGEYERMAAACAAATWVSHPFTDVTAPAHDITDERIAQWTDLGGGEAGLMAVIEPSARRNIQKARAEGVVVREAADALPFLEATHRENMAAIGGRAKPAAFFSALGETMTFGRDWRLYVAERLGEPLAALLTFEAARTVEYVMPVVKEPARPLQPTAAVLAHAMGDAAARGFTRWNWGGTWLTQEGVYRFKKKWGARERRYQYFVTVNDRSLLSRGAAELSAAYPWYFTVPFGALAPAALSGVEGQEQT